MSDKKAKSYPPPLKKFMHSRNPYKTPPSFKLLATEYPEFRAFCSYDINGKVHLDFKNPDALRSLAICLLDKDFQLKVTIPPNRLVPTIPLRLNYMLWIEDLLSFVHNKKGGQCNHIQYPITGYDVGTGASCIYPLLGAKRNNWNFIATESDDVSFECAIQNVNKNNLQNYITLRKSKSLFGILDNADDGVKNFLQPLSVENAERDREESTLSTKSIKPLYKFDGTNLCQEKPVPKSSEFPIAFTMCNPPFFSSEGEVDSIAKSRRLRSEPTSASTGSVHEMVTKGGEVAFIGEIMRQSCLHKDKIGIFTSLVGAKSDLGMIKKNLCQISPAHSTVTEFCQGRTMRWGIAWTFQPDYILERVVCKRQKLNEKPLVLLVPRTLMANYSVTYAYKKLEDWLKDIKLKPRIYKKSKYFIGATLSAYKATWLNQRRAKREQKRKQIILNQKNVDNKMKRKIEPSSEVESKKLKLDDFILDSPQDSSSASIDAEDDINSELGCQLATCYIEDAKVEESIGVPDFENDEIHRESEFLLPTPESSPVMNKDVDVEDILMKQSMDEKDSSPPKKEGLECILRCNLHIKQTNNQISFELRHTGGAKGKDAMSQLLQYIHNKLKGL